MKFSLALVLWLGFAVVLAAGLIRAVQGHSPWLLLGCVAVFLAGLSRYGCRK